MLSSIAARFIHLVKPSRRLLDLNTTRWMSPALIVYKPWLTVKCPVIILALGLIQSLNKCALLTSHVLAQFVCISLCHIRYCIFNTVAIQYWFCVLYMACIASLNVMEDFMGDSWEIFPSASALV